MLTCLAWWQEDKMEIHHCFHMPEELPSKRKTHTSTGWKLQTHRIYPQHIEDKVILFRAQTKNQIVLVEYLSSSM